MFKFLFFIVFLFFLLVFLLGFSSYANAEEVEDPPRSWKRRRKIYSQNEGEYVDYEEVK